MRQRWLIDGNVINTASLFDPDTLENWRTDHRATSREVFSIFPIVQRCNYFLHRWELRRTRYLWQLRTLTAWETGNGAPLTSCPSLLISRPFFTSTCAITLAFVSVIQIGLLVSHSDVDFRCDSSHKVRFYLNERPLDYEGCEMGVCDWEYLKEKIGPVAFNCNTDFCSEWHRVQGRTVVSSNRVNGWTLRKRKQWNNVMAGAILLKWLRSISDVLLSRIVWKKLQSDNQYGDVRSNEAKRPYITVTQAGVISDTFIRYDAFEFQPRFLHTIVRTFS